VQVAAAHARGFDLEDHVPRTRVQEAENGGSVNGAFIPPML
jgi:hypothetical protein